MFSVKRQYTSVNNKTWITLVILCNVWSWFSVISWNAWDFQSFRVLPGGHRNFAKWLICLSITHNDRFISLTVTYIKKYAFFCIILLLFFYPICINCCSIDDHTAWRCVLRDRHPVDMLQENGGINITSHIYCHIGHSLSSRLTDIKCNNSELKKEEEFLSK